MWIVAYSEKDGKRDNLKECMVNDEDFKRIRIKHVIVHDGGKSKLKFFITADTSSYKQKVTKIDEYWNEYEDVVVMYDGEVAICEFVLGNVDNLLGDIETVVNTVKDDFYNEYSYHKSGGMVFKMEEFVKKMRMKHIDFSKI